MQHYFSTKDIATQTQNIAIEVVKNADEKEFSGKHEVKAKTVSNNTVHTPSKSKMQTTTSAPYSSPKQQNMKPIISNTNDDEWASF